MKIEVEVSREYLIDLVLNVEFRDYLTPWLEKEELGKFNHATNCFDWDINNIEKLKDSQIWGLYNYIKKDE